MGVMSIREFNADAGAAVARAEAGETIAISRDGKVIAELRPAGADAGDPAPAGAPTGARRSLDDPIFRAAYERLVKGLEEGIPGLVAPATYAERTER